MNALTAIVKLEVIKIRIKKKKQNLANGNYDKLRAGAAVELQLNEQNQYLVEDDYLEAVSITSIKAEAAPGEKLKEGK